MAARRASPSRCGCTTSCIPELGRAVPYGVYDIADNAGWVSVGIDHDTASFAVNAIRRWWQLMGRARYPDATRLLITADGGGSNGSRVRLWKLELQKLADELGLAITVCHLPPGTSKWNKIEHRLFSFITQNWRGEPLVSHQVIVQLIAATTTKTGLDGALRDRSQHLSDGHQGHRRRNRPPSISTAMTSTANGTTPIRSTRRSSGTRRPTASSTSTIRSSPRATTACPGASARRLLQPTARAPIGATTPLVFGTRFPDYPKLGDSQLFIIVGVNSFGPNFRRLGHHQLQQASGWHDLPGGVFVQGQQGHGHRRQSDFTPVPSNQIDVSVTGYVVART